MNLQKIGVKFFLEKGGDLPLADLIPVFHRFIQENKLEGMLVDVAEYTHVHQGPGVLLIAHEANYGVDDADGRRGLLYSQKRTQPKDDQAHLKTAFRRALQACALLEKEPETAGKMKFALNHLQVFVNDRLEAPHNSQSLGDLEQALNPFLSWLYEGEKCVMLHEKDPHKRVGFEIKFQKAPNLEILLKRLESN